MRRVSVVHCHKLQIKGGSKLLLPLLPLLSLLPLLPQPLLLRLLPLLLMLMMLLAHVCRPCLLFELLLGWPLQIACQLHV
jgi:hypothetical protein